MSKQVLWDAMDGIREEFITETAAMLGLVGQPTLVVGGKTRERGEGAFARLLSGGWGVAVICAVVSLSVLSGIIWAGQRAPSGGPGGTETAEPTEIVSETQVDTDGEDVTETETPAETETEIQDHVHAFGEWRVVQEATCTEKGSRESACPCGETRSQDIYPTGHSQVTVPGVPPTTTRPGLSEGKECSVCGKVLVAQEEVEPLGHTDLAYEVNEDGKTCTITGMGSCTATEICIPSTIDGYKVTRIGEIAFISKPITSVYIPSSVTEIMDGAFHGCTELTEVTLPSSIKSMGYQVFQYCTGLTSVTVQCKLLELPRMTFEGCTSLTAVSLPEGLSSIGMAAFAGCTSLREFSFPASLQGIGAQAFMGCTALTDMIVPSRLSVLDDEAFEGCVSLTGEVVLPDGMVRIGSVIFGDCNGITAITVPADVKQTESDAFSRMGSLTDIHFGGTEAEWQDAGYIVGAGVRVHYNQPALEYALSEDGSYYAVVGMGTHQSPVVTIPDTHNGLPVKEIGASAFSSQDYVTSLHIGRNIERVGDWAFYQSTGLEEVWIQDIEQWLSIDFSGGYYRSPNAAKLYVGGELLTHLVVPDTVTEISPFAFAGCDSIRSVTVGAQVTRIGDSAFCECEGLTSVTFRGGVEEIGEYAFFGCASLEEVILPDTVTVVDAYAFYRCYALSSIHVGCGVETIGEGAFWDCRSLTEITLPASLTYIGKYAFRLCSSLQSVVFEVKTGWYAKQYATDSHISPFGEAALSAPETAAYYLTEGKEDRFWERKG